jgi:ABC-2 type transport system permease protein
VKKYFSILIKESLQIVRDLPGLSILFLMPALMLIIITLTQEKVMIGMDSGMKIILVNADSSALGNSIEKELKTNINFKYWVFASEKEAEKSVFSGKYQLMIVVPQGATEKLLELARQHACDTGKIKSSEIEKLAGIILLYDPAVMKIYKDILVSSLHMIIESTAIKIYVENYTETLKVNISRQLEEYKKKLITTDFEKEMPDFPGKQLVIRHINSGLEKEVRESVQINLPGNYSGTEELVSIEEKVAGNKANILKHDIVRNNVPAFILFAMFFIVIPLAGSILSEKQQGTKDRLMTLPVTRFTLFSGKITIYLVVCILQFFVMIFIGKYIFPLISQLPSLSLDVNVWALMAIVIASALAAIGFGLVIGTVCSTYGQAAPLGSVLVVILAILGGIFVPAYMMPEMIRKISIISPLRWGTDAFFSIFARGAGINAVLPQFLSLIIFFWISLVFSIKAFNKHK